MVLPNMCYSTGEILDLFDYEVKYAEVFRYSTFVLIIIACIVGLVGNTIVIFYTLSVIKKNKSTIWFLNLAIVDFVSLLLMPLHGFAVLRGDWSYGPLSCKIFFFVLCITIHANIFILVALNISRVLSVAKPIFYKKFISRRVLCWTCAVIWLITLLCSLPVLYFGKTFTIGDRTYCALQSSTDFDIGPFDPVLNLTEEHLTLHEKVHLDVHQKYHHFFVTCSSEKCCCKEDIIAKWDHLVFSAKCFNIPVLIISYFLPLFVVIFSNITIAIQVKKSQTVNPRRMYRLVITIIVVYFVTWTPSTMAEMFYVYAIMNRNIIMMFKVQIFTPLLFTIAYTNCFLDPIMYVLVGRQTRSRVAEFLNRLRSN
ncbi:chemerin-like receptor 1 [Hyperolius riggenbachi]|uniref:chemerin-like receptor 1 n=1 Tax=Hyperolius riggenbachi TaxID=752182 RepID=UPI0035A2AAC2